MTDASRSVRRLELALALLGLSLIAVFAIVALDAVRFHTASLLTFGGGPGGSDALMNFAMVGAAVIAMLVAAMSAAGDLRKQRRFLSRLDDAGSMTVDGRHVRVVHGATAAAFCAGWLRPRIYVSSAALDRLTREELRAVVAHEGHHADRRDPLRMLMARAAVRALPAVRGLTKRQALLLELAADAAAVRSLGSAGPLAGAMLAFDDDQSNAGVEPERVDHLVGDTTRVTSIPPALLAVAGLGAAGLVAIALSLLAVSSHPELPLAPLPVCLVVVLLLAPTSLPRGRRAERQNWRAVAGSGPRDESARPPATDV